MTTLAPMPASTLCAGAVEAWGPGFVAGWAWHPADPTEPIAIEMVVDGQVVATGIAGLPRADLALAAIGQGRHGFELRDLPPDIPGSAGEWTVRRVSDQRPLPRAPAVGTGTSSGAPARSFGPPAPRLSLAVGAVESRDAGAVGGWVWNPCRPSEPVDLEVTIDEIPIAMVRAGEPRAELAVAQLGTGVHGFRRIDLRRHLPMGSHVVRVRRATDGAELAGSPLTVDVPAGQEQRSLLAVGCIEQADRGQISGWAWDRHRPDEPVEVEILINGVRACIVSAAAARTDLALAGLGTGQHGFHANLSGTALPAGPLTIAARRLPDGTLLGGAVRLRDGEDDPARERPNDQEPREELTRGLAEDRARVIAALAGWSPIDFTFEGTPTISVVLVARNRFAMTMLSLSTLRASYPGPIELIVIGAGSTGEMAALEQYVKGAVSFHLDADVEDTRVRDAGLASASAAAVLFLEAGIELAPGAIAALLRRLDADPAVAAVGGLVLSSDGRVRAAGGALWRDGSARWYGSGLPADAPEVSFARDAPFVSGALVMIRRMDEAGSGDDQRRPAVGPGEGSGEGPADGRADGLYGDAESCLRFSAAGTRVVFDPAAVAWLRTGPREDAPGPAPAAFRETYATLLASRPPPADTTGLLARFASVEPRRVLFIENNVPLPLLGSGFVRSNDILRTMAALGFQVTVYPLNDLGLEPAAIRAAIPDTMEVIHTGSRAKLAGFLSERRGYFDVVWCARTHNLATVRTALEAAGVRAPLVILDTEAIEAPRSAQKAALEERSFDQAAALAEEFRDASFCDRIVTVSETEAAAVRSLGHSRVATLGHMRVATPTPRDFAERGGMLFTGAIHDIGSPNFDSLCWFIDAVLPLVEKAMGWRTRLTVAGYVAPGVSLDRFRRHPRVTLRGPVADLTPLYERHAVFIAPTRFAAGIPYKIHEAASFGVPVVASGILARQLDWEDDRELLSAETGDAARFANAVIAVQSDAGLWQRLRDAALDRIRRENDPADYAVRLSGVLGPAARQPAR